MRRLLLGVAAMVGLAMAATLPAELADYIAEHLAIRVGVKDNFPNAVEQTVDCSVLGASYASCGLSYMQLVYTGDSLTDTNWALYYHSTIRVLDVQDEKLTLTFITGDLYKVTPSDKFVSLDAGTWEVTFVFEYSINSETDFMPRYWIVVDDDPATATLVPNTDTASDQSAFSDPIPGEMWKSSPDMPLPQSNITTRYARQEGLTVLPAEDIEALIIPTPLSCTRLEGTADLAGGISINVQDKALPASSVNSVYDRLAFFGVPSADDGYQVAVSVSKDLPDEAAKAEGYTLKVEATGATVVGYNKAGAFYGLQSLVSLVKVGTTTIPCVDVVDAPHFPSREQHIDVARNFHSKEYILLALDQMAAYKINRFHFHLSDDEGWRIEIPDLPELTEVGSKRCFDLTETECLVPQLGSGPNTDNSGTGFFTRDEYIEIVKYANSRQIEVYPEFDMPGHSRAAVVSMEARYRKLMAEGKEDEAVEYRLMDPDDTSMYLTIQYYDTRSMINSCMPGALTFIRKLVTEMVAMHEEAGVPLKRWHFGADEAHNILLGSGFVDASLSDEEKVGKGQLDMTNLTEPFGRSPVCLEFFKEHNMTDGNALIGYLAVEVSKILKENDVDIFMAWQDGMTSTNATQLATSKAVLNFWDTLFWGGAESFVNWDAKGYQLVLSNPDFLYFDFPQEYNPKERGYYWAGRDQTIKHLFTLAPENLAQNAETSVDNNGYPYQATSPKLPEGKVVTDLLLGLSGQLWSEEVRLDEQAEYMMFPRLVALGERAWHKASWELDYVEGRVYNSTTTWVDKDAMEADWLLFANVMGQREAPKFEAAGVRYRVPVPGAVLEGDVLKTNIELPGIPIWYSSGGEYLQAEGDVTVDPANTFTVAGGFDDRRSRVETVVA